MGCGKTTQGKKLAKELGYYFIDLDDYISDQYDKTITDLFQEVGEEEFRKIETKALQECINDNVKAFIATGGGTPININRGVVRNPPPMPNMPDSIPVSPPSSRTAKMFTDISAMGRYICTLGRGLRYCRM